MDVGEPLGLCEETPLLPHSASLRFHQSRAKSKQLQSGVFSRKWSKGTVVLDCNTFDAKLPFNLKALKQVD
jgi:hypothetical protein